MTMAACLSSRRREEGRKEGTTFMYWLQLHTTPVYVKWIFAFFPSHFERHDENIEEERLWRELNTLRLSHSENLVWKIGKFGTEKAQNLHIISDINIFLFFCTELAQKTYKIGTEFLTCTRFCFQKSKLFGKILDQKIDRNVSEKAQKTRIMSSVNSP